PPYYENQGFQPENIYSARQPVGANPYPQYFSTNVPPSVPSYVPRVATYQSTRPVASSSEGACASSVRKIIIIMLTILLVVCCAIAAFFVWYFAVENRCLGSLIECGSSGVCIPPSQWCDGVSNCPNGEDETRCVRLFGPNFILEVYSPVSKTWYPVCQDGWNDDHGKTACTDMGYSVNTYFYSQGVEPEGSFKTYMKLNTSAGNIDLYKKLYSSDSCASGNVVSLRCIDCGLPTKSVNIMNRIVGGNGAALGQWPWQVSLHVQGTHVCGGSIITHEWIVTAAHCVEGRFSDPHSWRVYAGILNQNEMLLRNGYRVQQIISHPEYDTDSKDNDVALMKLERQLVFSDAIRPICLPNPGMMFQPNQQCWISGWGAEYQGALWLCTSKSVMPVSLSALFKQFSSLLQSSSNTVIATIFCFSDCLGKVPSNKLFFYYLQGDSGGPLVTNKNSIWWLVGDTSWGTGCASPNRPGVYGNMTVFTDWIYKNMQ
ncbi:Transmembrane protease serine 2, partial [Calypte anna]